MAAAPLTLMAGAWTGTGTITFSDGTRERLRCRSNYQPDAAGATMQLSLTCASDSYKFELASQVQLQRTARSPATGTRQAATPPARSPARPTAARSMRASKARRLRRSFRSAPAATSKTSRSARPAARCRKSRSRSTAAVEFTRRAFGVEDARFILRARLVRNIDGRPQDQTGRRSALPASRTRSASRTAAATADRKTPSPPARRPAPAR